jgi:type 1 glutamine amidotransferase
VLVFTKTEGYRHESIPDGVRMIEQLGAGNGFGVTETTDAGVFTADGLRPYAAVVFLSTNREVLDPSQQAALEEYVRGGGGWAGIHAASDTEYDWPFYGGELLGGAWFRSHPPIQPARVEAEDHAHPSSRDVPDGWTRSDEWYAFTASPRTTSRVLLRVDEGSYEEADSGMGPDHPIAWCRPVGRGRSWYTAMGHTTESYGEPAFARHVLGGILTATGRLPADCTPRSRPAPAVEAPASVARRVLRRRGLLVTVRCPRTCTARLRMTEGLGEPTSGRRLSRTRTVRVPAGAVRRVRLRPSRGRRIPPRVRVVAVVGEETIVRIVEVK